MRTSTSYWDSSCRDARSNVLTNISTGATTARSSPVYLSQRTPLYKKQFKAVSDLPKKNTRDQWNNFEKYSYFSSDPMGGDKRYWTTLYSAHPSYDVVNFKGNRIILHSLFGSWEAPFSGLPLLYEVKSNSFVNLPSNFYSLWLNANKVMLPQIKAELSLVNSLIELKDFKKLPLTIKRVLRLAKPRGRRTLRQILGGAADGYLQWMFNLRPLISDVQALRRSLSVTQQKVKQFLSEEGLVRIRHYNSDCGTQYPSKYEERTDNPPILLCTGASCAWQGNGRVSGTSKCIRSVVASAQFHAEIKYHFTLSNWQRKHAYELALLDKFGVNLNPSIIWNAIPWSFVVDWLANVSSWLSNFKYSNMEPNVVIHDCLASVNVDRKIEVINHLFINPSYPLVTPSRFTALELHENAYRRISGNFQYVTEAIKTSGFSLREIVLAGSLAASRWK